jgi:hypothetical protein
MELRKKNVVMTLISFHRISMIHWKYYVITIILIELIYHLTFYSNSRLYITLIKCPKKFLRLEYHIGSKPRNILMIFYNWYQMICRCRIIEINFYFSYIIRSIEIGLFLLLLINLLY